MFVEHLARSALAHLFCLAVLLPYIACAETVYHWVDAQGKSHFTDQAPEKLKEARVVEVTGPPLQEHSAESLKRLDENRQWFDQRTKERQAQEAQRAKEQAKLARTVQKGQDRCNKARQKLETAEAQYDVKRRTWLKPNAKSKLKDKLELYRSDMKRKCGL